MNNEETKRDKRMDSIIA